MRAARLTTFGSPLELTEVGRPELEPGEVLVETRACGVCHSDVGVRRGKLPTRDPPFTPGHEPMGTVAELGDGAEGPAVGTRVAVNPMVTCGECFYCARGRDDLCERWRYGEGDCGTIGRDRDGAFASFVRAPAENCIPLPDSIDDAVGAILVDACATSFNSVSSADFEIGDTVVVYGAGGVGSCALKYLDLYDHLELVVVDVDQRALDRAVELGADHTVDASAVDPVREIQELTTRGADVVFEFSGTPPAMENAVESVRAGGTVVVTGCAENPWEIGGSKLCLDAVEVRGSHGFTHRQIETVVDLVDEGRVRFDDILTHSLPLDEVNRAIDLLEDPSATTETVGRITIDLTTS